MELISAIVGFIVAIGLLIVVHEYGHFLVARRLGVKVLRFSIGFGKPILAWYDKQGTEYVIAIFPLGGYVNLLNEREGEIVAVQDRHKVFDYKSIYCRLAIFSAGPIANILFAIIAYWLIFILGATTLIPMLGAVPSGSVAAVANLHQGQEILSVNEQLTPTWEDISVALMPHLGGKEFVRIQAYDRENNLDSKHVLNLTNWSVDNKEGDVLKSLGLEPFDPIPAIVGKLIAGYPAEKAGLLPGDHILYADKLKIKNRTQLTAYLRKREGHDVVLEVQRNNDEYKEFIIKPVRKLIEGGTEVGFIGIQYQATTIPKEYLRKIKYPLVTSLGMALTRTRDYCVLTVQFLKKIFIGQMSVGHIAGPLVIAKYAGETMRSGVENFLGFLALVSISLGILNLLPIPILDGGQILFCLIELVTGKPLSVRIVEIGKYIGIILLLGLIILALHNDLIRL